MMLQTLLDLAVGFVVDSVVGSRSTQGQDFQREMHRYLDGRTPSPSAATPRRR
jgi:hypothetical protein